MSVFNRVIQLLNGNNKLNAPQARVVSSSDVSGSGRSGGQVIAPMDVRKRAEYSQLLSESRAKCNNILNRRPGKAVAVVQRPPPPPPPPPPIMSMVKLTNFVLYDDDNDNYNDNKSIGPLSPPPRGVCLFALNESDLDDIGFLGHEIDAVHDELNELYVAIRKHHAAYRSYCERLLKLCDEKEALFEMFVDYYEEYVLDHGVSHTSVELRNYPADSGHSDAIVVESSSSSTQPVSSSSRSGRDNRRSRSRAKRRRSTSKMPTPAQERAKSRAPAATHNQQHPAPPQTQPQHSQPLPMKTNEQVFTAHNPHHRKSNLTRRQSILYCYSVPTENRFQLLLTKPTK